MWLIIERVGQVVAVVVAAVVLSVVVALAVAVMVHRGRWAPMKRFSAFVLDFLYLPLRILFGAFGRAAKLDEMMVRLKNRANHSRFARSRRRLLLAPQCLRHIECPAPSTRRGVLCKECGRCELAGIVADARRLGYQPYILTGSSFVPRIVEEDKADAALLIACAYECNKVMMALGRLPTYCVCLERDGCVSTEVAPAKAAEAMRLGLEEESSPEAARS